MIRYRSLFCHCAVAFGLWFCFIEPSVAVDATDLKSPFTLEVGVIDRESGSAVGDALVLGREYLPSKVIYTEFGFPTDFRTLECIRSAVGRTEADGKVGLAFPGTDRKTASAIPNAGRYAGLLVYKPGYCIPSSAAATAFGYGPYEHQSSALKSHLSGAPVSYDPARLALDRSSDTGEHRLLYLTQLVSSSGCRYASGPASAARSAAVTDEAERSVAQAVLAEAERSVRTDYDRFLLAKLRQYNIAVLEVLASNPAVTIRREDREQLDQPEAQWTVIDPARVAYYRKLRDLTKSLPLRTAFKPSCPMLPTVSANRLQLVRPIPVEQRKP